MSITDMLKHNGGFTVAELLITVAIIAVLVAIAIPIFRTEVEKSREAHDIYIMRQAASLAADYYYAGAVDKEGSEKVGLLWWDNSKGNKNLLGQDNAAGVYDPGTGAFLPIVSSDIKKTYGKGTKIDTGKSYIFDDYRQIYAPAEDYTKAVVMVSIYPRGNRKHIDVYWKTRDKKYIGGQAGSNDPKYSIRINLE